MYQSYPQTQRNQSNFPTSQVKEQNFRIKYFCIVLGQQNHKFNCCLQCIFLFIMSISVTEIIKTLLLFIQNFHKQSQLRSHSYVCFKAHLEPPYPDFCFPKPIATLPSVRQPTPHSCYSSYLIWGYVTYSTECLFPPINTTSYGLDMLPKT